MTLKFEKQTPSPETTLNLNAIQHSPKIENSNEQSVLVVQTAKDIVNAYVGDSGLKAASVTIGAATSQNVANQNRLAALLTLARSTVIRGVDNGLNVVLLDQVSFRSLTKGVLRNVIYQLDISRVSEQIKSIASRFDFSKAPELEALFNRCKKLWTVENSIHSIEKPYRPLVHEFIPRTTEGWYSQSLRDSEGKLAIRLMQVDSDGKAIATQTLLGDAAEALDGALKQNNPGFVRTIRLPEATLEVNPLDTERLKLLIESEKSKLAQAFGDFVVSELSENPQVRKEFLKSKLPLNDISLAESLSASRPSSASNIFGRSLNFTLGVGLTGFAAVGSAGQFISLYNNPYANSAEKVLSGLAAADALSLFVLGSAVYFAPASTLGKLGGSAVPSLGAVFTSLEAGVNASFDLDNPSYGSQKVRLGLDLSLAGSGTIGAYCGYVAVTGSPLLGGGCVVASGAGASLSSLAHDAVTQKGIAKTMSREIQKQIKIKSDEGHSDHTFSIQIDHHLNLAQTYGKFDDNAVFYLLEDLKDKQENLDWRHDPFLSNLRTRSIKALLADAQSTLSFFGDEEAAALLFFGLNSPKLDEQADAVYTFLSEVKAEDAQEVWSQFVSQYGLSQDQYGDLKHFYETMADSFTKNTYSDRFLQLFS